LKKLFAIIVIFIFAFRIWQSTGCKDFISLSFDPKIVKISVEEQVSLDQGLSRQTARFFHNKASVGFFELAKFYSKLLEPRLILEVLGPIGIWAVALALTRPRKLNRFAVFVSSILTVATLWYFAFSWQMQSICNEIFFN